MKLSKFRPSPAMIVALLGVFLGLGGVGLAATGGNFILGQSNSAANTTSLTSGISTAPTLSLTNSGGRPAARFTVNGGAQPFTVSNGTKIENLNADRLDGVGASAFLPSSGTVTVSYSGADFVPQNSPPLTLAPTGVGTTAQLQSSSTGTWYVFVPVDVPMSLFGKTLKLKSVQVCYLAGGSSAITSTDLRDDGSGGEFSLYYDATTRPYAGITCYTVTPGSPKPLYGPGFEIALGLNFASTSDVFDFYPGTVTLTT
jgi:hypothetical protein